MQDGIHPHVHPTDRMNQIVCAPAMVDFGVSDDWY